MAILGNIPLNQSIPISTIMSTETTDAPVAKINPVITKARQMMKAARQKTAEGRVEIKKQVDRRVANEKVAKKQAEKRKKKKRAEKEE